MFDKFKEQNQQDFLNPYKIVGGMRGLCLKPFFKRCGLPVVVEAGVQFTDSKSIALGKWIRLRLGTQVLSGVTIGNGVFVGRQCSIGCDTVLQDNVTLADRVCILSSTHDFSNSEKRAGKTYSLGKTIVGKGTWIGCGAIVLPQVRYIGKGAVIGAGAVVTKDVPDHSIAVGNPAKVIRQLDSKQPCASQRD